MKSAPTQRMSPAKIALEVARNLKSLAKSPLEILSESTSSETQSDSSEDSSSSEDSDSSASKSESQPRARVLTWDNLQHKISTPYRNFEGCDHVFPPGTEVLLCSDAGRGGEYTPCAAYAYGVVSLSGNFTCGAYKQRMYFDPFVVLPEPIQSKKAWGQGYIYVRKCNEHQVCFEKVKKVALKMLQDHSPNTLLGPDIIAQAKFAEAGDQIRQLEVSSLCFIVTNIMYMLPHLQKHLEAANATIERQKVLFYWMNPILSYDVIVDRGG